MGALCSTQSDVYVEHGSAIAQDVVLGIIDTANTTVGNASRTKGETAPVLWKVVEHNGSSLDVPVDADGKCIDLRDDEVWILAPFAYCAKAGLLDEATRDASGELAYRAILKSTPAYRDGLLEMGGLFVLWRAQALDRVDGVAGAVRRRQPAVVRVGRRRRPDRPADLPAAEHERGEEVRAAHARGERAPRSASRARARRPAAVPHLRQRRRARHVVVRECREGPWDGKSRRV